MSKFNFTEEQIQQAQQVANLIVTLNKAGICSFESSVENAEEFIKAVNGIEDKGKDNKAKVGSDVYTWDTVIKDIVNSLEESSLLKYMKDIEETNKAINNHKW